MTTVGDIDFAEADVFPFDETTDVSFALIRPDGSSTTLTATPLEVEAEVDGLTVTVQRWTSLNFIYTAPTRWVIVAIVNGTGADVEPKTVWVDALPLSGGALWAPSRARVADFVPHRTVPEAYESGGQPLFDFTDDTTPRGYTVDRLIIGAVGWVLASTGDLHITQQDAAQEVAALRAAGFVELAASPNADRELAESLFKQADAALKALTARNRALTGADGDDPTPAVAVMPVWSFPPPSPYGDLVL